MSDIPDREQKEREIAAALAVIFARYNVEFQQWAADEIAASGGSETVALNPPPQQIIDAMKRDIIRALVNPLAGIHYEAAERLANEIGAQLTGDDSDKALAASFDYAQSQATELAESMSNRLVDNLLGALTAATAVAAVGSVLGADRPAVIAATETTRANTRGEITQRGIAEAELGAPVEAVWRTEQDNRVCPFCEPLDGLPENEWPGDAGDGPPRHPNCRCYLDYVVADAEVATTLDTVAF